ncbi:MAG: phycobiliprotein lyase [Cyanosarcina radialis HA8281-LM2]|jgi:hypothetical protein|nr:phycobiliprotein lyase [Cyanosarcina radialis HA8281-LM2]
MLTLPEFFNACTGLWKTERIYHYVLEGQTERSYTEFRVESLTIDQKQQILSLSALSGIKLDRSGSLDVENLSPGFAIAFDTRSETGEEVSMSLQALFVPDTCITIAPTDSSAPAPPAAASIPDTEEAVRGFYLRNEGYSEAGAIAGRFTYLPSRQTLEMTTYYRRSVALDQMRLVAPDLRLRTILTYQRPQPGEVPTVINLAGFGVEYRS